MPGKSKDEADAFACSIVGAILLGGMEEVPGSSIEVGEPVFDMGDLIDLPVGLNNSGVGRLELPMGMKGMSLNGF